MKIDLTVAVSEEIFTTLLQLGQSGQLPPVAKFGHVGTHFDVMNGSFSLDNTERRGRVFDVSHVRGRDVEIGDLAADTIAADDFVMFSTGWLKEKHYGTPDYFRDHPQLSNALITYLVDQRVALIGLDAAGIRQPAEHPAIDQYCADNNIFVVENLANLEQLLQAGGEFIVHTYPVNYLGLSGLPCRVVAELAG